MRNPVRAKIGVASLALKINKASFGKAIIEEAIIWASPFILSHISIFKAKHSLGGGGATLTRVKFHRVVFNVCSAVIKLLDHCC